MTATPGADPSLAIVGRVRRAHGVQGEVVIELHTDAPNAIFASGARVFGGTVDGDAAANAPALHVRSIRPFKDGLLVQFNEIADRNSADLWRGRYLLVPTNELSPAADDELFLHQLVGLRVELADGTPIGSVVGYYEMPYTLLLEIKREHGTSLMPYAEQFVESVDLDGGKLVVNPPAGLFD